MALSLAIQPCFASDGFTLYLVRHAEKQENSKNPALTQCGKEQAKQLATLLSTAKIDAIYSTSYQRTMATASPLAKEQRLAIKNYHPQKLEQFALHLKQMKRNTLVVGHSNTTPQLTKLLTDQKIASLNESDYQVLYQVKFHGEKVSLTKFAQPHLCPIKS